MDDGNPDIRDLLQELESLVRAQGDEKTGELLREISRSPDPFQKFREALKSKKARACNERKEWFEKYPGLSLDQVEFLTSITDHWELGEVAISIISAYARVWTEYAWVFWEGPAPDEDLLQRCYTDSQVIQVVVPLREKAISFIIAEIVEDEQNSLKSKNGYPVSDVTSGRDKHFLTKALKEICHRHYGGDKEKLKWLRKESSDGMKYQNLDEPHVILSLYQVKSRNFKRHNWADIEVAALNAFVKTLPQRVIFETLKKAWHSVVKYYRETLNNKVQCQGRKRQRQDGDITATIHPARRQRVDSAEIRPAPNTTQNNDSHDVAEILANMPNSFRVGSQDNELFIPQDDLTTGFVCGNNSLQAEEHGNNRNELPSIPSHPEADCNHSNDQLPRSEYTNWTNFELFDFDQEEIIHEVLAGLEDFDFPPPDNP
ncbi:hypothetical protein UA08_09500 [Talaromyces atroroseus]|uniref:Uncharacterized protein n=1 Tax=Talaromyces atroroseus TaxID=1441469 RepID=A0A1Q5Q5Y3_TALAT|nr:hypothetical protein UA08_09500 [Talaromyces atroroseus]OKL55235.1 hypothetical protein UA08_09500 [Talaromyces atroroseus]